MRQNRGTLARERGRRRAPNVRGRSRERRIGRRLLGYVRRRRFARSNLPQRHGNDLVAVTLPHRARRRTEALQPSSASVFPALDRSRVSPPRRVRSRAASFRRRRRRPPRGPPARAQALHYPSRDRERGVERASLSSLDAVASLRARVARPRFARFRLNIHARGHHRVVAVENRALAAEPIRERGLVDVGTALDLRHRRARGDGRGRARGSAARGTTRARFEF